MDAPITRRAPPAQAAEGAAPDKPVGAFETADPSKRSYTVAFFDRVTDTSPKQSHLTWNALAELLTKHEVRALKDGRLFSPVVYYHGYSRGNRGVNLLTLAVGDFDDGTRPELVRDHLARMGLAFAIYSTHSSSPGHPRFRAIVPLLDPVGPERWGTVWPALVRELFLGRVDLGTKDPARIFYMPSAPPGSVPFVYRGEGHEFDTSTLMLVPEPARRPLTSPGETARIPKGERRPKLMSIAGRLRHAGAGFDAILAELRTVNDSRCDPKLSAPELERIAASASKYQPGPTRLAAVPSPIATPDSGTNPWAGKTGWDDEPPLPINMIQKKVETEKGPDTIQVPVETGYVQYNTLIARRGLRPFRTRAGEPRVAIPTANGVEIRDPSADEFVDLVGYRFYTLEGSQVPKRELLVAATAITQRGLSRELPPERVVDLKLRVARVARDEVLLDLADASSRCVRIRPDGWTIETTALPVFERPRHMLPLPEPVRGGGGERLWEFLPVPEANKEKEGKDPRLVVLAQLVQFLVAPDTPKPMSVIIAGENALKTSTAETLQRAVDPSITSTVGVPDDEEGLQTLAFNHAIINIDNVSDIEDWLSDGLARLTTGTGYAKRRLYSDRDEVVTNVIPWIILNGITASPRQADSIRRTCFVDIETPDVLRSRSDLAESWTRHAPEILGGLLDLACGTLAILRDDPPKGDSPNMGDFVRIGRALERFMGLEKGTFDRTWEGNLEKQRNAASENPWLGALLEVFRELKEGDTVTSQNIAVRVSAGHRESFPKGVTPQMVGNAIARLQKTLESLGLVIGRKVVHGVPTYFRGKVERGSPGSPLDKFSDEKRQGEPQGEPRVNPSGGFTQSSEDSGEPPSEVHPGLEGGHPEAFSDVKTTPGVNLGELGEPLPRVPTGQDSRKGAPGGGS